MHPLQFFFSAPPFNAVIPFKSFLCGDVENQYDRFRCIIAIDAYCRSRLVHANMAITIFLVIYTNAYRLFIGIFCIHKNDCNAINESHHPFFIQEEMKYIKETFFKRD